MAARRTRLVGAGLAAIVAAGVAGAAPATAVAGRVVQTGNDVSSTWTPIAALPGAGPSAIDEENQWAMALVGGAVYAWGTDEMDQLGTNGPAANALTAVRVAGLPAVRAIDGGRDFGLAITEAGSVYAWGSNQKGDLGNGSTVTQDPKPGLVDFPAATTITQVSAGNDHSLALDSTGHVWAWGDDYDGDLGLGAGQTRPQPTPVRIPGLSGVVALSAGCDWSMALDTAGRVWTWGLNLRGQLGDGSTTNSPVPVELPALPAPGGLPPIKAVSAGGNYGTNGQALALDTSGHVWAWGDNRRGQLGIGSTVESTSSPVEIAGLRGIVEVSAGGSASLARSGSGQLWVWGSQAAGQLGGISGGTGEVRAPARSLAGVRAASAGALGSLAVR